MSEQKAKRKDPQEYDFIRRQCRRGLGKKQYEKQKEQIEAYIIQYDKLLLMSSQIRAGL